MVSIRRPDPVRSLASIRQGETVVVECILFDIVRSRCETKGIRLGERLRCRDVVPGRLLLETARGALVAVEQAATVAALRLVQARGIAEADRRFQAVCLEELVADRKSVV